MKQSPATSDVSTSIVATLLERLSEYVTMDVLGSHPKIKLAKHLLS